MRRAAMALAVIVAACGHPRPVPVAIAWRWLAPSPAYVGMPATANGAVFATYGHSVLVNLDASTGRVRWKTTRVGLRDVAPTPTAGAVLAATDDGLVAFSPDDGRVLWERALGERASTPVVVDGAPIVTTWEGHLIRVDGWTVDLSGPSLGPPAAGRGIVVAAWDTGVLAAEAATGRVLWRHEFAATGTSAPAVTRDVAVLVGGDRRIHAYDLGSGRQRWSRTMAGAGSPEAPPAAAAARVAVVDRLGHLEVLDATSGRRLWRADGGGAVERGGPAFVGAAVALPLDDGRLLLATRKIQAFRRPSGRVTGVAAHAGRVLFANREGDANGVTALDLGVGKSPL